MREVPCPMCDGKGWYDNGSDCGATDTTQACVVCEGSGKMVVLEKDDLDGSEVTA